MLLAIKKALIFPVTSLQNYAQVHSKTFSRLWILLSIGTLILSGIFSVVIVLARTPFISSLIPDPLFARRGLVVHVDLALLIWLYAFLCGLFILIPDPQKANRLLPLGYGLAVTGVAMLLISVFVPAARPVLSNYIPVLDHPLFTGGLILFGAGVGTTLCNARLVPAPDYPSKGAAIPGIFPKSALPGLRASALLLLISFVTFWGSWLQTPSGLDTKSYYELTIWGGGHLLQFVNVAAMLAVWIILLGKILNHNAIPYRWSAILFGMYILPVLAAPLLTLQGTQNILYHQGFTRYMQWGIFPVVTVFMGITITLLIRNSLDKKLPARLFKNPYFGGLLTSMLLTATGFILGAMIRGSNTLIPAHYHAAVGGITVAFMAVTYLLMEIHGIPIPNRRLKQLASVQPLIFGLGQAVFAAGFGYAGAYGLARKSFGTEQQINSAEIYTGLGFMTVGGLLAISGGILFLWIALKAWLSSRTQNVPLK